MSGNNNRKLFDNLVSRTKIYLVIIFILLVILSYLKPNMIIPSIIFYLAILGYTYFANNKRRSEISEQLQDLTLNVDSAAKSSLINAPFPLLILETDGNIVWKSSKFITEFANIDINNYFDFRLTECIEQMSENTNVVNLVKVRLGDNISSEQFSYILKGVADDIREMGAKNCIFVPLKKGLIEDITVEYIEVVNHELDNNTN